MYPLGLEVLHLAVYPQEIIICVQDTATMFSITLLFIVFKIASKMNSYCRIH